MHISATNKPHIFLTMGDPSGIGPEVIVKAMASPDIKGLAIFVIIGDREVFRRELEKVSGRVYPINVIEDLTGSDVFLADRVNLVDPGPGLKEVIPGEPSREGSLKALKCLEAAVALLKEHYGMDQAALVTAPLSKERVAEVLPGFVGHTEFLRDAYSSELVTMVLVGEGFSVVPVTRHIPIKEVAAELTKTLIEDTILQAGRYAGVITGKNDPRIGVCALNPHCGEGGKVGDEEVSIIVPAIEETKAVYGNVEGPIAADTIFYKAVKGDLDLVVAMYHDQGLAPFKLLYFDKGVNLTLGLEHIRTSPDHGTAFDIAGKGIAVPESMEYAIKLAVRAVGEAGTSSA